MEEKRTPTYEQKIEFLRGEMPEWIETKMQRPFRLWHEKKELYLPPNEGERYDALFVCRSAAADACEGEGGSNGQRMEAEIFPIRPEFSTNALQAILLVIKRVPRAPRPHRLRATITRGPRLRWLSRWCHTACT